MHGIDTFFDRPRNHHHTTTQRGSTDNAEMGPMENDAPPARSDGGQHLDAPSCRISWRFCGVEHEHCTTMMMLSVLHMILRP